MGWPGSTRSDDMGADRASGKCEVLRDGASRGSARESDACRRPPSPAHLCLFACSHSPSTLRKHSHSSLSRPSVVEDTHRHGLQYRTQHPRPAYVHCGPSRVGCRLLTPRVRSARLRTAECPLEIRHACHESDDDGGRYRVVEEEGGRVLRCGRCSFGNRAHMSLRVCFAELTIRAP